MFEEPWNKTVKMYFQSLRYNWLRDGQFTWCGSGTVIDHQYVLIGMHVDCSVLVKAVVQAYKQIAMSFKILLLFREMAF